MGSKLINTGRKTKVKPTALNSNHQVFAREYVANGMVGVEAYLSAYPNCKSRKSARVKSCELLKNPGVRGYISTLLKENGDYELRRAQLLAKDRRLNDFNPLYELCSGEDGYLEVTQENIERVAALVGDCVTEFEVIYTEGEEGTKTRLRIKLMSKDKAHERERKYHGIDDAQQVDVKVSGDSLLSTLLAQAESEGGIVDDDYIEGQVVKREE